ncbi:hypothetical protein V5O48_017257, partial [Marasmius crinis-equi]
KLSEVIKDLESWYSIGNVPQFPDKRIYVNKYGNMWDLRKLELACWGAHIVILCIYSQGHVDYNNPPHVPHFDIKKRFCMPTTKKPTSSESSTTQPALSLAPAMPSATPDTVQLVQLMTLKLLNDISGNMTATPPTPTPVPTPTSGTDCSHLSPTLPTSGLAPVAAAPPSPIKQHGITLETFCQTYDLSSSDYSRLSSLCYRPSDKNIDLLTEEDWHGVGFQKLEWLLVLRAHCHFLHNLEKA